MTHEEIKKWLDQHKIENYTIRLDGVVDVRGNVDLYYFKGTTLPIQFGYVTGNFRCIGTKITSLKGSPYSVDGEFMCYSTNIKSLKYAPEIVGSHFHCHGTNIKSLSGIDKMVKHIGASFLCNDGVTHILGILLIEGITHINVTGSRPVSQILNKYRGTGDILSAQDELIDAGFIDQARL